MARFILNAPKRVSFGKTIDRYSGAVILLIHFVTALSLMGASVTAYPFFPSPCYYVSRALFLVAGVTIWIIGLYEILETHLNLWKAHFEKYANPDDVKTSSRHRAFHLTWWMTFLSIIGVWLFFIGGNAMIVASILQLIQRSTGAVHIIGNVFYIVTTACFTLATYMGFLFQLSSQYRKRVNLCTWLIILYNLVLGIFLIASLLFLIGNILALACPSNCAGTVAASYFVAGSGFVFLGGIVNVVRAGISRKYFAEISQESSEDRPMVATVTPGGEF